MVLAISNFRVFQEKTVLISTVSGRRVSGSSIKGNPYIVIRKRLAFICQSLKNQSEISIAGHYLGSFNGISVDPSLDCWRMFTYCRIFLIRFLCHKVNYKADMVSYLTLFLDYQSDNIFASNKMSLKVLTISLESLSVIAGRGIPYSYSERSSLARILKICVEL